MVSLHQDFIKKSGFELDSLMYHYSKVFDGGKQVLFFHQIQYPNTRYIEVQLGVRFNLVENIINQFLPSLGDFKERSVTHVIPIYQLDSRLPRRFILQEEFEVNDLLTQIEEFLLKDGFHWLDKYSVPENMEMLFNNNPNQVLSNQNFTYRAARAVTLAKLYNKELFDLTKKAYLEKSAEMMVTPFTLASFLNLLNHLENLD